jgi:integrase
MHQRTRDLAPLLPALVTAAENQRRHAARLLAAARLAGVDEPFEVDDETLVRVSIAADPANGGPGRPGLIYADEPSGTRPRNLTFEEDKAFWGWALIEVLRHTGVRIEELLELTHRSFAAYTLPTTGEVIPLLQITPSKTDRERLLVVSPELGEVLTAIIFRVRAGREHLPLVSRYGHAERLHSPHLPFLFQRPWGLANVVITPYAAKQLLDWTLARSGLTHPDGTLVRFTPHDFRRIFATEAVASGLSVHIAAKLLGHESLNTSHGYVAVYDRDVIEHHRAFIARRRRQRPSQEYRDVIDEEWDEFLAHFEKRKVELGICGRAYATPCQHEHACLRCPLLRPDPAQLPRLTEIHTNLLARLAEAHEHGWAGEVDGLEVSLAAAQQKLEQMRRTAPPEAHVVHVASPTSRRPTPIS